jgi:hypothetical protein
MKTISSRSIAHPSTPAKAEPNSRDAQSNVFLVFLFRRAASRKTIPSQRH